MNVRGHCSTHNGPDTESAPAFSATPDCAANEPPARPAAVTFIEADDPTAADRSLRDQVESAQWEEAYTGQSCLRQESQRDVFGLVVGATVRTDEDAVGLAVRAELREHQVAVGPAAGAGGVQVGLERDDGDEEEKKDLRCA